MADVAMDGVIALGKAKQIINSTITGIGSSKVVDNKLIITFNDGKTQTIVFPTPKDGVSVTDIKVNASNQIVFTMSDGTEVISGTIPTIKGDKGDKGTTGDKGEKGEPFTYDDFTKEQLEALKGNDGLSPTVTITDSTGRHTVSITDKDGVKSFVVKDGTPEDLQNYYTKDQTDTKLKGKANVFDIPTVPTNISELNNDENYIKNTVDNLVNYYTKTETYSQTEVNALLANLNKLTSKIVTSLPSTDIDANTIYLIEVEGQSNVYMQYMYINGGFAALGTTAIDLSNVYTKTEIDTKLKDKAEKTEIPTVPTNVSELVNDAGYLTSYTETDPTVPAWAKEPQKPKYTAVEVGALPDNTEIPIFTNKKVLDKFSVDANGKLLYDGNDIENSVKKSDVDDIKNWITSHKQESIDTNKNIENLEKKIVTYLPGNNVTFTNNADNTVTINSTATGGTGSIANITIDTTTKHWMIDGKDSGVSAVGQDGVTPSIGANGNWYIDTTDTGIPAKGADGRSIKSIAKDDNNNIIVTFTDNTTQNIGQLNVDISADFLTENGFGNIRYYQGKFQYYDIQKASWIDASATPDNTFIMGLTPNSMKSFKARYDTKQNVIKLTFEEPDDTLLEGQSICLVEKVVIRRKKDEIPSSIEDGIEVVTILRKNFRQYDKTPYIDNSFTPSPDEKWYYRAFPVSTLGVINNLEENNVSLADVGTVYGFILNQKESDPANMITYIEENSNFASAYMDYTLDEFNYGDWGNAWFIKNLKPVMLKYDGTVAYELNKNDFTKKNNGEDSDIANVKFEGNAMIGIPKVYWKILDNGDDTCNVYFSDQKVDGDFHCYSHIDNNGNEIDYCYMPIYNGSKDSSNRLRSISGISPLVGQTGQTEIAYAKANNLTSDEIWNTEVYSDRILITLLLLLIGKSTDTQTIFGRGVEKSGSLLKTGTMDKKGLFYGTESSSQGVKVFGIENFWGNIMRRIAGYVYTNNIQKVKMTYNKNDGSTGIGYNTTGEGYIEIPNSMISANGTYINIMLFNKHGLFPKQVSGSSSTFYTDGCYFTNGSYPMFGGYYGYGSLIGALFVNMNNSVSYVYAGTGCAVSCKPLT